MRSEAVSRAYLQDEEIVALYWERNEKAIQATDAKYKSFLLAIGNRILANDHDSEECLNDTYIGAWNAIPPARPTVLKAFLGTIMRRISINRYKANQRQKRVASEFALSMTELEDIIGAQEDFVERTDAVLLGKLISDYVRSLSRRRAYIFMGRYYFSRPIAELASALRCSESMVHKEIAAIKRDLRESLEKEGYTI